MKTTLLFFLVAFNAFGQTLPPDAEALRAKRDAKVAEINQAYANALEKLQKKALAEGNLEAANVIQKEIATATPDPFVEPLEAIIGKWKRVGSGTKYDGDFIDFADEKSGVFNGTEPFKVRYNPSKKLITIENDNWANEISLTPDPDVLNGKTDKGLVYQLVRVK